MKIQHIVMIAVIIAVISLGLQVASNTKLQSDIKNVNSKTIEQDIAIQHLTIGLNETLQMNDLKNKTAEQEQLVQSLSNELDVSKQIEEENNVTITQLQQNTANLNGEIKSLSERLASLEDKMSQPSSMSVNTTTIQKSVNTASTPMVIQNKTNVTGQIPFLMNQTTSITKPEIKILSITMSPNPLKVGDAPQFTVTYQNISDKVIFQNLVGCGAVPSLHWEINPSSSVQRQLVPYNGLTCAPVIADVTPNGISIASGTGTDNTSYQIITDGKLNVILRMNLEDGTISGIQATIQFNVNATQ
jgi:TolA-binding protein